MSASLTPCRIAFAAILSAGMIVGARAGETAPITATAGTRPNGVRVAGIVLKWLRMDKEANYRRGEKMIREAAEGGAKIVVTTEGFLDGYMIEDRTIPLSLYRQLAERVPGGEYYEKFASLARELKEV